jgi:hypothetical protein
MSKFDNFGKGLDMGIRPDAEIVPGNSTFRNDGAGFGECKTRTTRDNSTDCEKIRG